MKRKFDLSIKYYDNSFKCHATALYQDCEKIPDEKAFDEWEEALGDIEKITITFK